MGSRHALGMLAGLVLGATAGIAAHLGLGDSPVLATVVDAVAEPILPASATFAPSVGSGFGPSRTRSPSRASRC